MDIKFKFDKNFIHKLNELKEKYGEEITSINGFGNHNLNFSDFIDNFIDTKTLADATIDSNANSSSKDIVSLQGDMIKPHLKLLSFNKIYIETKKLYGIKIADEWIEEEWKGVFYLHNSHQSSFKPYCFAFDLERLAKEGMWFLNKGKSSQARHLDTWGNHVLEFVAYTSNRITGACGIPSFLIYSFFFWKEDVKNGHYLKSPEYYRDQQFQVFIYNLNQSYLRVSEASFTNISIMDREYLIALFGDRLFPNGEPIIDYIEDIIEYQKSFMEVVSDIRKNQIFTYPVITYALLFQEGKFIDEEFARWCNKHNMEWYDSNFYISEDVTSLSACCRYVPNIKKLEELEKKHQFVNSIGGSTLNTGSVVVNTTSMYNLSLECSNIDSFYIKLREKTRLSLKILNVVRNIIVRNIEKGILPIYSNGLIDINRQYNTLGVASIFETVEKFNGIITDDFGNRLYSEEGIKIAENILNILNEEKDEFEKDINYLVNTEQCPIEGASPKLALKAKILHNSSHEIFGNQWIPLHELTTLQERVKMSANLDKKCNGGAITHLNIDGGFSNEEQSWKLLNKMANDGIIYFAYNRKISGCEDGHGFYGDVCWCGKEKTEEYLRIVGFITPVSAWSKSRKSEYKNRKWFDVQ